MKKLISLMLLLPVISLSAISQKSNTLTPEEFKEGWQLLFDGETLSGWTGYNTDYPKTWEVRGGELYCSGKKSGVAIMTEEMYGDFDLKFEWKIEEKGNSGVLWHVREGKQWSSPPLTGPEYQIFDEQNQFHKKSVGSCYDVYETNKDKKVNPAMEWNSGRIRVCKGQVTYWLNDVITVNYHLYSKEWKKRVADSKWKDKLFYGRSPFGHISFQNHHSKVWYKNIKIRKLD